MRRIAIGLVLPLLLAGGRVRADDDPLAGLSGARALEFAKVLASDAMAGRRSGVGSGRKAEDWVQGKLVNMGLEPMDGEGIYMNAFTMGTTIVEAPIELRVGGSKGDAKPATYGVDYVDQLYTGAGTVESDVVFVGYGITAKDRGLDDYEGVDVKGKIVLALRGAPALRESEFVDERMIGWKSSHAADLGAAAFLVCDGTKAIMGTVQNKYVRPALPVLWVTNAIADALLAPAKKTITELKAEREAGTPVKALATGSTAKVEVHGKYYPNVEARNVIGGFRGVDPEVRNETIVVGAHLDHLGQDATGRVFNGADDNASGSSSLLALAETLAKNGWRPRRTVVFAWFAGEEQGLAGSRAMAAEPVFPHKHIVAMINLDMSGQGTTAVKVGGRDGYPEMWKRMTDFVAPADRAAIKQFRVEENSDHWPFHERGIPAFFAVTDGDHPNYHQLSDDAENLKPECLEAAARVVGRMLVGLAEVPTPLHTGRETAGYALREKARVVEGPASAKALSDLMARAPDAPADPTAFVDPGYATVILPLDERSAPDGLAFEKLDEAIKLRRATAVLVRSAGDQLGGPKAGRTGVLPRYACADTARTSPASLEKLRAVGVRWIDPFDRAKPPTDAERDAILAAAVSSKLIVDLTGLPDAMLAPARAKLGDHPATWRAWAPMGANADSAAKALVDRRKALGPLTLVLLAGGADEPLLTAQALGAPEAADLAPVAIVSEDTPRLEERLACVADDLADPKGPIRGRVRSLFGGTLADLLRRVR